MPAFSRVRNLTEQRGRKYRTYEATEISAHSCFAFFLSYTPFRSDASPLFGGEISKGHEQLPLLGGSGARGRILHTESPSSENAVSKSPSGTSRHRLRYPSPSAGPTLRCRSRRFFFASGKNILRAINTPPTRASTQENAPRFWIRGPFSSDNGMYDHEYPPPPFPYWLTD